MRDSGIAGVSEEHRSLGENSRELQDMLDDVLERVVLHLVVGLENPPDGQDVTTSEVERAGLGEAPAVGFGVAMLALVVARDSTQIGGDRPLCMMGKFSFIPKTLTLRLTIAVVRSLEQVTPGSLVHLVARYTLGIPRAKHVEEEDDEIMFGVDHSEDVVGGTDERFELLWSDGNDSNVSILCSAIEVDVLALGLEAVEESGDVVLLGIRSQLASSVDYPRRGQLGLAVKNASSSLCSSIASTAMC